MSLLEKIALALSLLSMLAIITIIVRKFSVLSILNTDNIPGEKEAKFKKFLIKKRVDRDLNKLTKVFIIVYNKIKKIFVNSLGFLEKNLHKFKAVYNKKRNLSKEDKSKLIKDLFRDFETSEKKEDFETAEAKLLEVINIDQNNLRAFFFLGRLYQEMSKFTESVQTLNYALKLAIKQKRDGDLEEGLSLAEIYFSLAEAGRDLERLDYALECISEALDLEANNPRYLDLILDLSIMKKDKGLAWNYFNRMSAINPENNKLLAWKEEIEELEDIE